MNFMAHEPVSGIVPGLVSIELMKKNRIVSKLAVAALATGLALLGSVANSWAAPKKVLVVTVTKGFRHSSIPTAEKVLAELGESSKAFTVDYVRNDAEMAEKMTVANLKNYDAVIFA